jgi:hypothetical protein
LDLRTNIWLAAYLGFGTTHRGVPEAAWHLTLQLMSSKGIEDLDFTSKYPLRVAKAMPCR